MTLQKDGRYYLSTVCIFNSFQGKGYCTPFIRKILTSKRYATATTYLEVAKDNEPATRCYTSAGFLFKEEYDDEYDVYEYAPGSGIFNLMVYAMACNDPGLAEQTGAVSLELGVTSDVGKLAMSAFSTVNDQWRVAIYVDIHPKNYVLEIKKIRGKVHIDRKEVKKLDTVLERVDGFLHAYYSAKFNNVFVIGGHGMPYPPPKSSEFAPVAYLKNGRIDRLKLNELAKIIPGHLKALVLDSCCLGTLETVSLFKNITDYIVAYQAEGPWNGFISTDILSFCGTSNIDVCLRGSLRKYKEQSTSQENPSPVTLIATRNLTSLSRAVQRLPSTDNPIFRDILRYAKRKLSSNSYETFKRLYDSVVIAYEVPENYEGEREHGLNAYL